MSVYAVVRRAITENPGKTEAQLTDITELPADAVNTAITMLVDNSVVAKTGSGAGATYANNPANQ